VHRLVCRSTSLDAVILRGVGAGHLSKAPCPALVSQSTLRAWARGTFDADQMKQSTSVLSVAGFAVLTTLAPTSSATDQSPPNYAAEILGYSPGTGAANGYQQPNSSLGEPSRLTPGEFGGPVEPFNAPWQSGQLVSLGAGGSLTIRFQYPVLDLAGNPHGLDFLVFGSSAFLITNGDFSGGGITDGSLFGSAVGPTRVSVSPDGVQFFTLDPALAPIVDGFFPTDGSGDFSSPVSPTLKETDFNGLGLSGIRSLYLGSGGGTAFDIGWARNAEGSPATLDSIQFVRIDVLGDRAEIDGFSAVPEPTTGALMMVGSMLLIACRRPHPSTATRFQP